MLTQSSASLLDIGIVSPSTVLPYPPRTTKFHSVDADLDRFPFREAPRKIYKLGFLTAARWRSPSQYSKKHHVNSTDDLASGSKYSAGRWLRI